jgi:hypothetical protein
MSISLAKPLTIIKDVKLLLLNQELPSSRIYTTNVIAESIVDLVRQERKHVLGELKISSHLTEQDKRNMQLGLINIDNVSHFVDNLRITTNTESGATYLIGDVSILDNSNGNELLTLIDVNNFDNTVSPIGFAMQSVLHKVLGSIKPPFGTFPETEIGIQRCEIVAFHAARLH